MSNADSEGLNVNGRQKFEIDGDLRLYARFGTSGPEYSFDAVGIVTEGRTVAEVLRQMADRIELNAAVNDPVQSLIDRGLIRLDEDAAASDEDAAEITTPEAEPTTYEVGPAPDDASYLASDEYFALVEEASTVSWLRLTQAQRQEARDQVPVLLAVTAACVRLMVEQSTYPECPRVLPIAIEAVTKILGPNADAVRLYARSIVDDMQPIVRNVRSVGVS